MLLTVFLLTYYIVKIYVNAERSNINIGKFTQNNLILLPFAFMLIWALISTFKSPYFEKSLYGAGYINEGYFTVLQYAVVFLSAYAIGVEIRDSHVVESGSIQQLQSLRIFFGDVVHSDFRSACIRQQKVANIFVGNTAAI